MKKSNIVLIGMVALMSLALGAEAALNSELKASVQPLPTVTSSEMSVLSDKYDVYRYDDGATRAYAVVIPKGLKKVRGLFLNASYDNYVTW